MPERSPFGLLRKSLCSIAVREWTPPPRIPHDLPLRRELRLRGREVVVEPLVFDLLLDLVRHRDRVVTKDELLDRVWSGAIVTGYSWTLPARVAGAA